MLPHLTEKFGAGSDLAGGSAQLPRRGVKFAAGPREGDDVAHDAVLSVFDSREGLKRGVPVADRTTGRQAT
jgi:hypothetical protein